MAVYKRLLLAAGGGIVSSLQQAKQAENTASLLIGLGGTGTDCIRAIKTQVRTRLRSDNPDAVVPTYTHIRFLGVDTDESQRGDGSRSEQTQNTGSRMPLDETEYFSIANAHVDRALKNERTIASRKELGWLRYKDIEPNKKSDAGAGGVRQIGRFMMMDKANAFMSRVKEELNTACTDLTNRTVNIHIFAGLSGGTGAGTFLDVCYMVREVAEEYGATIFGYFFLPDVNASRIPLDNRHVHSYLPKNGYAALQELNYCMQLHSNGGSFVQEYKGGRRIEWDKAPVDMCHVICATNQDGHVLKKPYDYAMSATAEYVMDFLTKNSDAAFSLTSHYSNFLRMVSEANANFGACMSYIAIGASCASVPMREINTYLASELFHQFAAVRGYSPSQQQVDALAASALGSSDGHASSVYESLWRELRKGGEGDFTRFNGDWRMVAEQGNKRMVKHYTDQRSDQAGAIAKNAANLSEGKNEESLLRRVEARLMEAVRDVGRGPMWAHRALDAATGYNLLNVVDGLIETNNQRWEQESVQEDLRKEDYENARADFEAHQNAPLGIGCQRRFEAYEWYLMQVIKHWLDLDAYRALDSVLRSLCRQLVERDASYYGKLAAIMGNLADTFEENRGALRSQDTVLDATGGFEEPLMSIAELKDALDEEVRRVDVPNMLDAFMVMFADNEGEWAAEDEARIARLVNGFFVERAFRDFAGRTITRFLQDKYGTTNDEELVERVYREWMRRLTDKASPLFHFDPSVWDRELTSEKAFVSVPEASGPISAAARRMNDINAKWEVKESDLTDRIYVMCSAQVFPLASYTKCSEYEEASFRDNEPGRHYYESPSIAGMPFSDWHNLPSLTPQSIMKVDHVPHALAVQVRAAQELFEDAMACGALDMEGTIFVPEEGTVEEARRTIAAADALASSMMSRAQIPRAKELLTELKQHGRVRLVPSGQKVFTDGNTEPDVKRTKLKDYFVSSPALHRVVRETVGVAKPIADDAAMAEAALQEAIVRVSDPDLDIFFDALFSGVIVLNGFQASFEHDEYGIMVQEVLTSRDREKYPFCSIPPYQAFLSFRQLSQKDKDDLARHASERFNNQYDEVAALAPKLVAELGDSRIQAWAGHARNQENRDEIMAFIGDLKQRFASHRLDFGA